MDEEIQQVPAATPDFQTEIARQLAEMLPEIVADGKIDVAALQTVLGEDAASRTERFGLFWPGKTQAIRAAQTSTTATLAPDRENSVDWDNTQNVVIEGDNLEVLKILRTRYHGEIKMIYIDPPYNTGNDFVYGDDYTDPIGSYLELTGQRDSEGKLSTNTESDGRFHSNWLSMMYPRLKIARELLTRDGVIFISIGDREVHHLISLMTELFGEGNAMPLVSRITKKSSNNGTTFSPCVDYIVAFSRDVNSLRRFSVPLTDEQIRSYNKVDERGAYKEIGLYQAALKHGGSRYPITVPDGRMVITPGDSPWRWSYERFQQGLESGEIVFKRTVSSPLIDVETGEKAEWNIYTKLYLSGREDAGLLPKNIVEDFQNNVSSREIKALGIPFDFPKPSVMISYLASAMGVGGDDIILDFFAGSGTTAHAVMALNAEDGGHRRCISVQLPEVTADNSEARKAGYSTISEITRERIRRAGKKILAEESAKLDGRAEALDVGFRAYKLVDTNFAKWRAESSLSEGELTLLFEGMAESADDDARPEALLTEILLKLGFSLTERVETMDVDGLSVFSVNQGLLIAYVNENVSPSLNQLRALVGLEPGRLIVLEDAFQGDDELKTNLVQECRSRGVDLWTV